MKRLLCITSVLIILTTLCGCSRTSIKNYDKIELTFITDKENINVTLTDDEAAKIADIIDGNAYEGATACPFDKDISINIDGDIYAVACDDCNMIKDINNKKCFAVSENEMKYIRTLFEKYGGHFSWLK